MSQRWELDEIEVSRRAVDATLRVVERTSRQRNDVELQWRSAIRLAQADGASLRDIATAAGVAPQTVANICKR